MNLRITVLVGSLLIGSVAFAAPTTINFVSQGGDSGGGSIEFLGTTMSFPNLPASGHDFLVSSCVGCSTLLTGLQGNIDGSFTIGAITTSGSTQTAPVTGTGVFSIIDGAAQVFKGDLDWLNIQSSGSSNGLNIQGSVNVTNLSYTGTNADLLYLFGVGTGTATLTFTFNNPTRNLSDLTAGPAIYDSYSGQYSPVPEPSFYGLLGLGVAGAIWLNQRKKKTA